jgi:lactoylglutathione lyase
MIAGDPGGSMAKSIHSMIRVLEEERSVSFYQKAFGLKLADRLDFDSFTLIYLSNPESEFELELSLTISAMATDIWR